MFDLQFISRMKKEDGGKERDQLGTPMILYYRKQFKHNLILMDSIDCKNKVSTFKLANNESIA